MDESHFMTTLARYCASFELGSVNRRVDMAADKLSGRGLVASQDVASSCSGPALRNEGGPDVAAWLGLLSDLEERWEAPPQYSIVARPKKDGDGGVVVEKIKSIFVPCFKS